MIAKMRVAVFLLTLAGSLALALAYQVDGGRADTIDTLINTLKESFNGVSSQRDLWHTNYIKMKGLIDRDTEHLEELLFVSKMAVSMLWGLYASQVRGQKAYLPRHYESSRPSLPFTATFDSPLFPYFHTEATILLKAPTNFYITINRDDDPMLSIMVDFQHRHVHLSDGTTQDRITLVGESFPNFHIGKPFTINIQVADDCVFTSFWLEPLLDHQPKMLPTKHKWCTQDYRRVDQFSVVVSQATENVEGQQEDLQNIELVEFIVYDGVLIQ